MKPTLHTVRDRLDAIRQEGNPYWNIDPATGTFLIDCITSVQAKRVLEIGTSIGLSALYMIEPLLQCDGELVTVESHADRFAQAQKHFFEAGVDSHIIQVHGHAPEILDDITGIFDLMFFDATKMEHVLYFEHLKDRLATNGLIIADNFLSHHEAMYPLQQTVEADPSFTCTIHDIGTGLLVIKKV